MKFKHPSPSFCEWQKSGTKKHKSKERDLVATSSPGSSRFSSKKFPIWLPLREFVFASEKLQIHALP